MKSNRRKSILENYRSTFFMLGLTISLAVSYYALSYESVYEKVFVCDFPGEQDLTNEDDVPITIQKRSMPEKVEKQKSRVAMNQSFMKVPDYIDLPDELFGLGVDSDTLNAVWDYQEESEELMSIQIVEKWPIFEGCESLYLERDRQDCFESKLIKYVQDEFKVRDNAWGNSEQVLVHFKIDKKGFVTDVRATRGDEFHRQEAERIIRELPQFKPAEYQGRKVATTYSLPINIK